MAIGYSKNGFLREALLVYVEMLWNCMEPGNFAFSTALKACADLKELWVGRGVHAQVVKSSEGPDQVVNNSLLRLYTQCECFDEVLKVFDQMPERNIASWNSLISGFVKEDKLALCSGKEIHVQIVKSARRPDVLLLNSLVDIEVPLAEAIAKRLFEIEPYNPGNYVMLSNIYANAGMWDSVNMVREMMQTRRIRKEAGCSWVQVKNKIHTFVAGGGFKFRNSDEYKKVWNKLREAMEEVGYVTNTDVVLHDVNEETKAMWVCGHSERLATVFSLLYTAAGMPIRITKNLRVCIDCHSWIKIVSRVTGRVIVLRDTNRFHHFKEGACSCNDYW
ncbi:PENTATRICOPEPTIDE REPEAT-CONTAINING PROTEIN [Salix purpurea]|uniref:PENTATRICOPEPTIDE REPEAT-CONTAINING PROTEIN n=1 Tax=Salix purpurea TaxID=77065 RepID=A0A9Q0UQZ5_SALPP|nr:PENTATRICOPEPTIDE REPEAT-CONTAINING PROTEIN [Salix purpurea]